MHLRFARALLPVGVLLFVTSSGLVRTLAVVSIGVSVLGLAHTTLAIRRAEAGEQDL